MSSTENNITFFIDEPEDTEPEDTEPSKKNIFDINNLLNSYEKDVFEYEKEYADLTVSKMVNYNLNYTNKELLFICDYYGIAKKLKNTKSNKEKIIETLVFFENDPNNKELILRRKKMWFCINELKNDKFMKKYIMI